MLGGNRVLTLVLENRQRERAERETETFSNTPNSTYDGSGAHTKIKYRV